jgi:hypothetical protein
VLLERIRTSCLAVQSQAKAPRATNHNSPSHWEWTRLGDVITLLSGQHLTPAEYSGYASGALPYITGPADFGPKGLVITRQALVRKAVATKGQVLLTVKGAGVGKTALCDVAEVAISRQLMALEPIEWNTGYLLLITQRLALQLRTSARSLIPGISREDVAGFAIALPPLEEQHRIVAKVEQMVSLCDEFETAQTDREARRDLLRTAALRNLAAPEESTGSAQFFLEHSPRMITKPEHVAELRQAIWNLAVRGRLVPQASSDEPAAELCPSSRPRWGRARPARGALGVGGWPGSAVPGSARRRGRCGTCSTPSTSSGPRRAPAPTPVGLPGPGRVRSSTAPGPGPVRRR